MKLNNPKYTSQVRKNKGVKTEVDMKKIVDWFTKKQSLESEIRKLDEAIKQSKDDWYLLC